MTLLLLAHTNATNISTTNSKRVPTALTWLMVLCTYGQSMLVFLIYGFKGEIYQQWYKAVQIRSFRRVTRRAGSVRHMVKGPGNTCAGNTYNA
eukprot:18661-Heterococcus_DN1.PRE.2